MPAYVGEGQVDISMSAFGKQCPEYMLLYALKQL